MTEGTRYGNTAYFAHIDPGLPDEDRLACLKAAWALARHQEPAELVPADVQALRDFSRDASPGVRAVAIDALSAVGPVTWEDLEQWAADSDWDPRHEAIWAMEHERNAAGRLADADKERWAGVIAGSAKQCGQMPTLRLPTQGDRGWFEALWPHLGRLLDLGRQDLNTTIICGYLEDVLVHGMARPGDPLLDAWLHGDSIERKMALLSAVQWFGMREDWQRRIAETLARDPDQTVSLTARSLLAGQGVPDIQAREWDRAGHSRIGRRREERPKADAG